MEASTVFAELSNDVLEHELFPLVDLASLLSLSLIHLSKIPLLLILDPSSHSIVPLSSYPSLHLLLSPLTPPFLFPFHPFLVLRVIWSQPTIQAYSR